MLYIVFAIEGLLNLPLTFVLFTLRQVCEVAISKEISQNQLSKTHSGLNVQQYLITTITICIRFINKPSFFFFIVLEVSLTQNSTNNTC